MARKKLVEKQLKEYIKKIKTKISLDKAYIVGSWANGTAKEDSDVDILVLSKSFKNMDFDERMRILYRNSVGIDFDLHLHPVTEEELTQASELTALGAMRTDKKINLIS